MSTRNSDFALVRSRARLIAAVVRSLLSVTLMLVVYYQAPLDRPITAWLVVWLILGVIALAGALGWQLVTIMKSDTPRLRAAETIAIGLPFLLICYAAMYSLLSVNQPASFTQKLGRTDALYFTMTVFSTIGFGDIAPVTEVARIVTMTQMVAGLIAVGVVAKLVVGAVKRADERISAETAREAADPRRLDQRRAGETR
jgi:voltage-gated potassium channel